MRKNKTWAVYLFNQNAEFDKSGSEQIQSNNFYTSDTEAYLSFRPYEDFTFDSATIAMLNKDDGSIFERSMIKENDVAVYRIESEVIQHFGLWQAQVLFKQGEEIFTSTPVTFTIERYMMTDRPPRVEDVVSWKDLYENATETIQELNRINDELANTNQIVEQAESQRETAESDRVSAETQRQTDHANRSAELNGKADKVILKNLVENGDFSDGTTGWRTTGYSTEMEVTNGVAKAITYDTSHRSFIQILPEQTDGDIIYVSINTRIDHPDKFRNVYMLSDYSATEKTTIIEPLTNLSRDFTHLSGVVKYDGEFRLRVLYNFYEIGAYPAYLDDVVAINLTQTFGAGNEPTKEQMDKLIEVTGYIDEEYALNNKEMLEHLMNDIRDKADKVAIENLVRNGDFRDGRSGWSIANIDDTIDAIDGVATIGVSKQYGGVTQILHSWAKVPSAGEKYYFCANIERDSSDVHLYLNDGRSQTSALGPQTGFVSNIRTLADNPTALIIKLQDNRSTNWTDSKISNVVVIDLTETFGAGNEPSKEEMDELIKVAGYIDEGYALNNKEMLKYLMDGIRGKADKEQEDWITPTLLNGWEPIPSLRFYKDQFGVVHITGRIGNGTTTLNTVLFGLPAGYRPPETVYKEVATYSAGNELIAQMLTILPSGVVTISFGMSTYCVINISFRV